MIENIIWFPLSVYNMHSLGYIYMCTDTLYYMWTLYMTGHCNIQYYVIYIAENDYWIRLQNILYNVCFKIRDSLPDDDDDDDDDKDDISTCDMEATDDEVAEIFRKHISW